VPTSSNKANVVLGGLQYFLKIATVIHREHYKYLGYIQLMRLPVRFVPSGSLGPEVPDLLLNPKQTAGKFVKGKTWALKIISELKESPGRMEDQLYLREAAKR
jgi:hypothetical protein